MITAVADSRVKKGVSFARFQWVAATQPQTPRRAAMSSGETRLDGASQKKTIELRNGNPPARTASESGTTLMEVVITASILTVLFASLFSAYSYGFKVLRMVRENQRAIQILLEKSETVRLYNWEQVNTSGFIPASFVECYDPQMTNATGTTYYGSIQVTNFPGAASYGTNIRQVVLTLRWTNGIGHLRTLATLVAKNGEQNYVY
jgi:type II secretory pathway pseudopilin PulG